MQLISNISQAFFMYLIKEPMKRDLCYGSQMDELSEKKGYVWLFINHRNICVMINAMTSFTVD